MTRSPKRLGLDCKRVDLGRKTIRIEAPGCTIYIERTDSGTKVDIVSDTDRFAGKVASSTVKQYDTGSVVVLVEVKDA
jgi:hypothetical protein